MFLGAFGVSLRTPRHGADSPRLTCHSHHTFSKSLLYFAHSLHITKVFNPRSPFTPSRLSLPLNATGRTLYGSSWSDTVALQGSDKEKIGIYDIATRITHSLRSLLHQEEEPDSANISVSLPGSLDTSEWWEFQDERINNTLTSVYSHRDDLESAKRAALERHWYTDQLIEQARKRVSISCSSSLPVKVYRVNLQRRNKKSMCPHSFGICKLWPSFVRRHPGFAGTLLLDCQLNFALSSSFIQG